MWARFQKIDKGVDRFGYWAGAYTLLTGVFGWLSSHLTAFGTIRWPEAVFIGLGVTALLMLTASVCLALYRYFRPLPQADMPEAQVTEGHLKAVHQKLDEVARSGNDLWNAIDLLEKAVFSSKTLLTAGRESRIEALEKHTEHLRERMNSAASHIEKLLHSSPEVNLDLLQLLHFAVDEATLALLDRLMEDAPTGPIPLDGEKDYRDKCYKEATNYIEVVTSAFGTTLRGVQARSIVEGAVHDGERAAEKVISEIAATDGKAPNDRIFEIRRYKIADLQCQRLKAFLFRERAEVSLRAANKRDSLIERLKRRDTG